MKSYIRTKNGLVDLECVEAISWKKRTDEDNHDTYPLMIIFFLRSGTTFIAYVSHKSLYKAQTRFKELWTREEEVLDISEGEDE